MRAAPLLEDGAALLGAALVALTGLGLVGYDIWRSVEGSRLPEERARQGEVREYVLFTDVPFGKRKVMTGVQYASTAKRSITEQWCYLNTVPSDGALSTRLTLAAVAADGTRTINRFKNTALGDFGITAEEARALVGTHCRFQ